jgi:hypothetical protein
MYLNRISTVRLSAIKQYIFFKTLTNPSNEGPDSSLNARFITRFEHKTQSTQ